LIAITHPTTSQSSADKTVARRNGNDLVVAPSVPLISGLSLCFFPGATGTI